MCNSFTSLHRATAFRSQDIDTKKSTVGTCLCWQQREAQEARHLVHRPPCRSPPRRHGWFCTGLQNLSLHDHKKTSPARGHTYPAPPLPPPPPPKNGHNKHVEHEVRLRPCPPSMPKYWCSTASNGHTQAGATPPQSLPIVVVVVVVEWLYYSKRIIIVRWADLSDFSSISCVFLFHVQWNLSLFFWKTITSQNGLLIFLGKETPSETKSWKSSRILTKKLQQQL